MAGFVGIQDASNNQRTLLINADGSINVSGAAGGGAITSPIGQATNATSVAVTLSTDQTDVVSGTEAVKMVVINPADGTYLSYTSPTNVVGPTAVGAAAGNPPILIGGTANAGATGNVQVLKVDANGAALVTQATAANLLASVGGLAASGASVSGNPVLDGGRAATTAPTAVTDGQAVAAMYDKVGRAAMVPHAVRDLVSDQTTAAIVDTTVTTIVTAAASTFNDIIGLIFANSGTATTVTIKDDTTTRATFYCPANDTRGVVFAAPFKQATVNKNWTATCTGTPTLIVTTQFVKNI